MERIQAFVSWPQLIPHYYTKRYNSLNTLFAIKKRTVLLVSGDSSMFLQNWQDDMGLGNPLLNFWDWVERLFCIMNSDEVWYELYNSRTYFRTWCSLVCDSDRDAVYRVMGWSLCETTLVLLPLSFTKWHGKENRLKKEIGFSIDDVLYTESGLVHENASPLCFCNLGLFWISKKEEDYSPVQ